MEPSSATATSLVPMGSPRLADRDRRRVAPLTLKVVGLVFCLRLQCQADAR
jgi:hypothetical protein